MPPSRRTPPPVDPAPVLADTWRNTAAAVVLEPDPGVRSAITAELSRQLQETAAVLRRPPAGVAGGTAAATLAEFLAAGGGTAGVAGRADEPAAEVLAKEVLPRR